MTVIPPQKPSRTIRRIARSDVPLHKSAKLDLSETTVQAEGIIRAAEDAAAQMKSETSALISAERARLQDEHKRDLDKIAQEAAAELTSQTIDDMIRLRDDFLNSEALLSAFAEDVVTKTLLTLPPKDVWTRVLTQALDALVGKSTPELVCNRVDVDALKDALSEYEGEVSPNFPISVSADDDCEPGTCWLKNTQGITEVGPKTIIDILRQQLKRIPRNLT